MKRVEISIKDAYGEYLSDDGIKAICAEVKLFRGDNFHLIATITVPKNHSAKGNAAAIGTWEVLRGIDDLLMVEELQGIPKRFWFEFGPLS